MKKAENIYVDDDNSYYIKDPNGSLRLMCKITFKDVKNEDVKTTVLHGDNKDSSS